LDKLATVKQINYLKHILSLENIKLDTLIEKSFNELTQKDISFLFSKLNINIISPSFKNKHYIIEKETTDYIIGKQIIYKKNETITYNLIAFKYLLVLDWDMNDESNKDFLLSEIKILLKNLPYTFLIYETFNGYHAYCVSHIFHHQDYKSLKLMKMLKCDNYYIAYAKKVGFVVRLNKKQNRNEKFVEKFVCQINNFKINNILQYLIELKDSLIKNE
jgi:hypothetical protein